MKKNSEKTRKLSEKLKSKKATISFAAAGLLGGIYFIRAKVPTPTGQVIVESSNGSMDVLSLIGLILIVCSLSLIFYTIKNRKKK